MTPPPRSRRLFYAATLIPGLCLILGILYWGQGNFVNQLIASNYEKKSGLDFSFFAHFLTALICILGITRCFGWVFNKCYQPAVIGEIIGIHALFGAFIFGVIFPRDSALGKEMPKHLQELIRLVFLPVFFSLTGLKTQIGLLNSSSDWL